MENLSIQSNEEDSSVNRSVTQSQSHQETKRKRANASAVWNHFTKDYSTDTALCHHCQAVLSCPSSNGTTNLKKHLETCKKGPYVEEMREQKQKKIGQYMKPDGTSELKLTQWTKEGFKRAVATYLVLDELPFRHVEGEGFRTYSQYMNPNFFTISRTTAAKEVWKLFDENRIKLKLFLQNQRVSVTTDCWTSIQNIGYMCVTVHWIDAAWNLHKRIISFSQVEDHRGETMAAELMSVFKDWGITKVFSITVDNASANDVCIARLKTKMQAEDWDLIEDGELMHVRCSCHILNLIVGEGLKLLANSILVIRNAVRYIRSSPARTKRFNQYVKRLKITCKSHLCMDVCTRWNSTYSMLEAALKFEKVFQQMSEDDLYYCTYFTKEKKEGPPKAKDWENAKKFLKFLKTFYDLTKRLSATDTATSNLCFTDLCDVKATIEHHLNSHDEDTIIKEMCAEMKVKFNSYWDIPGKVNPIIFLGTLLDPRYKVHYINYCLTVSFSAEVAKDVVTQLNREVSFSFDIIVIFEYT